MIDTIRQQSIEIWMTIVSEQFPNHLLLSHGTSSIPFVVHTVNRCRHESLRNPHCLLYLVVTRYWAHSGKKVRSLRTKFPSAEGIGKVAGGSGSGCCSDIFHSEELLWTN